MEWTTLKYSSHHVFSEKIVISGMVLEQTRGMAAKLCCAARFEYLKRTRLCRADHDVLRVVEPSQYATGAMSPDG